MSTLPDPDPPAFDAMHPSPQRKLAIIALLAVLYLVFGHVSLLPLVQDVLVTPAVFYSTGIALAFALWFGAWVWPGVFLGQFALAVTCGLPWLPSLGIAASNGFQSWLSAWMFQRLGLDPRLERARDLAGLMLLISFVWQPCGGTLAHAALWLGGVIDTPSGFALSWRNWWLSGVIGQMLVTPLLLSLFAGHRSRSEAIGDVLIGVAVLTPAMIAGECLWLWTGMSSVIVLLAPVFIWIAITRGLVAVCSGGIFVAAAAMFATGHGWGPFAAGGAASILDLNVFLVCLTLGKQFIAVFLRQLQRQRETEARLRAEEEELRISAILREKALESRHRQDLEARLKTSLAAAAVAHEIVQPLSTILLQSNMAIHGGDDARGALAVVATEAQRVVTTIDKMKTLLRSVATEHHPVDLGHAARGSLLYNAGLLQRHGITVREWGLGNGGWILGDAAQLQLAINNILRNAAEAIEESAAARRDISIELTTQPDVVVLAIGDSGPGWSGTEHAETPLATTKSGGTGIGLFVVRTAVQNHGGTLDFGRSTLGGAEVRMTFPRTVGPGA